MRDLAKFLGVEENVVFKFKDEPFNYIVRQGCLMKFVSLEGVWELSKLTLEDSKLKEIVLPKTFTDFEIEFCKTLGCLFEHGYIARDKDEILTVFSEEPERSYDCWFAHKTWFELRKDSKLFKSIKWSDDKPTKISDIINSKGE